MRKQVEHQTHLQRDYQEIIQAQEENMYVLGKRIGILEAHAPHSIIFPLGVSCTETITDQGRVAWNGDVKMRSFHRPAQASLLTHMLKRCCRRRMMLSARRYSNAVQKQRLQPEIAACSVCMRQSADGMSLASGGSPRSTVADVWVILDAPVPPAPVASSKPPSPLGPANWENPCDHLYFSLCSCTGFISPTMQ